MICGCLPPIRVRKDQNTIVGGVRECGRFRNWRYAGESCTVSGKKSSELSEGDTVEYAGEFFCIFVWTMGALAGALLPTFHHLRPKGQGVQYNPLSAASPLEKGYG